MPGARQCGSRVVLLLPWAPEVRTSGNHQPEGLGVNNRVLPAGGRLHSPPLTAEQRKILRQQSRMSELVVQASLNVFGAADIITHAVGQPVEEVQSMIEEANRWNKVCGTFRSRKRIDELKAMMGNVKLEIDVPKSRRRPQA